MIEMYQRCTDPQCLDIKYIVRSLNPAVGLRIGLSNKSLEKCLINQYGHDKQVIEEFEKNVFGYSI